MDTRLLAMKSKMILDRYLEFDKDETEYYEWLIKVFHLVPSLDWNLVKIPEFEFSAKRTNSR